MKTPAPLFEIEDRVVARPLCRVAPVAVEASEDNVTGVAGIALVGELLDRLGVVEVADRHHLRPIGPGGYSGGECYRPLVELQLAGGDFLSDVSLLKDEATRRLRGSHALPSHTTLFRFLAGADLGRVMRAQAVNREMLRRSWAMGAAPAPGRLTIDPDATYIDTSGKAKEGSRFSYKISWPMPQWWTLRLTSKPTTRGDANLLHKARHRPTAPARHRPARSARLQSEPRTGGVSIGAGAPSRAPLRTPDLAP